MALECNIQTRSSFDRKHYFYSDLPAGYQITQQYGQFVYRSSFTHLTITLAPIALGGKLAITLPNFPSLEVRIKQIQLEQDTAKSTFNPRTRTSHIDLNRAGTGLMEIVSEPDLRSPEEAGAYVRALQAVLRAVGASDGNMEQGSLRCDVNVSVNRVGRPPGTRCEIKNLNSVRHMMAAIVHEVSRQRAILESAPDPDTATVPQETRGFDEHRFETYKLRSKEDAPDYRYMPDPNLGVLVLTQARIQAVRDALPELPWDTRKRLQSDYGLSERDVEVLLNVDSGREVWYDGESRSAEAGAVAYFDRLCAGTGSTRRDPKVVVNWMTHELLGQLTARKETFKDNHLSVEQLGELIDMVQDKIITGTSGKMLLRHMLGHPSAKSTKEIAAELQLNAFASSSPSTTSDDSSSQSDALRELCREATVALPAEVEAFTKGNKNVLNKIVGRVMKDSRGRADAQAVRVMLEELLQ
ncbi:hypothetical protein H0H81_005918 [Sphagnurus paluster]|uniref:Asn/Gln amidotransferase domain-containing protein n=1 Tax=Sphagnurus paluster TaxID=117069 RepID=A0A9P7GQB1_9AGAR|nr:hypothetical protein H0H81_005918 [Sphagnurus paluster]